MAIVCTACHPEPWPQPSQRREPPSACPKATLAAHAQDSQGTTQRSIPVPWIAALPFILERDAAWGVGRLHCLGQRRTFFLPDARSVCCMQASTRQAMAHAQTTRRPSLRHQEPLPVELDVISERGQQALGLQCNARLLPPAAVICSLQTRHWPPSSLPRAPRFTHPSPCTHGPNGSRAMVRVTPRIMHLDGSGGPLSPSPPSCLTSHVQHRAAIVRRITNCGWAARPTSYALLAAAVVRLRGQVNSSTMVRGLERDARILRRLPRKGQATPVLEFGAAVRHAALPTDSLSLDPLPMSTSKARQLAAPWCLGASGPLRIDSQQAAPQSLPAMGCHIGAPYGLE